MKKIAIIPAYNEEGTIREVISRVRPLVDSIVVIDNKSNDKTLEYAEEERVSIIAHETNMGKAQSIKDGFRYAIDNGYEYAITVDADLEHDPALIPSFFEKLEECDIVVGQRKTYRSSLRRMLNQWSMAWFQLLLPGLTDVQCGLKAYRTDLLRKMEISSNGFEIEMEILLEAMKNNATMKTITIENKAIRKSHLKASDYIRMNNFFDRWILKNRHIFNKGIAKNAVLISGAYAGLASGTIAEKVIAWTNSSR